MKFPCRYFHPSSGPPNLCVDEVEQIVHLGHNLLNPTVGQMIHSLEVTISIAPQKRHVVFTMNATRLVNSLQMS